MNLTEKVSSPTAEKLEKLIRNNWENLVIERQMNEQGKWLKLYDLVELKWSKEYCRTIRIVHKSFNSKTLEALKQRIGLSMDANPCGYDFDFIS